MTDKGTDSSGVEKRLIKALQIVDENIKNEAAGQPLLFVEAARYRVACMRELSRAKTDLEAWRSQTWLKVKAKLDAEAKETGGGRVVNDQISAVVQRSKEFFSLTDAVADAEARDEFSRLLLEAYRQRMNGLKIMADADSFEFAQAAKEDANRKLSKKAREMYDSRGKFDADE